MHPRHGVQLRRRSPLRPRVRLCTTYRSAHKYRKLYDKDLRAEVMGDTGGAYGKLLYYALASPSGYVADVIDAACQGWGCDEIALIELFVRAPDRLVGFQRLVPAVFDVMLAKADAAAAPSRACWKR